MSNESSIDSTSSIEVEDLPLVVLLTETFHEKTEEEKDAVVEQMRALRTNAAKSRSKQKRASNKIEGKTRKGKKRNFTMKDLFGGE